MSFSYLLPCSSPTDKHLLPALLQLSLSRSFYIHLHSWISPSCSCLGNCLDFLPHARCRMALHILGESDQVSTPPTALWTCLERLEREGLRRCHLRWGQKDEDTSMWSFRTPVGSLKKFKIYFNFCHFPQDVKGCLVYMKSSTATLWQKVEKKFPCIKFLLTSKSLIISPVMMDELFCAQSKNTTSF